MGYSQLWRHRRQTLVAVAGPKSVLRFGRQKFKYLRARQKSPIIVMGGTSKNVPCRMDKFAWHLQDTEQASQPI
jgi:hypothetical protein